jgi:hypothetical protein
VDAIPAWSYSKRQSQPLDPVTLVYVGSAEELARAFRAAGWSGSRENSLGAGLRAIRAVAEDRAYRDGPMRTLLLDGAEPDFTAQKALNTFARRHHLRAWRRGEWAGRAVWASAATEDIGTTFSMRPFGFTHEIENSVDGERDKVVSDVAFTGCVDSVAYLDRALPLRAAGNRYRRGVTSDSRIAVVVLNSCESPRTLDVAAAPPVRAARPGPAKRWARRVVLTTRSHVMRDNLYWRIFDGAQTGVRAIRHWREDKSDERQARMDAETAARAAAARMPQAPDLEPAALEWWPLVAAGAIPAHSVTGGGE